MPETFTRKEAISEGRIFKGTVLQFGLDHVLVDIGKSKGMLPIADVLDHEGKPRFQPGDVIEVMRVEGEIVDGHIKLSHQKARRLRTWEKIEKAHYEKSPVAAQVIARIKGGLTVSIQGMPGFLPRSQADLGPIPNPDALVGHTIEVAVIKVNKKRGNIIVSRRQLLEEEQDRRRSKTLEAPLGSEVSQPPIRVSGSPALTTQARSAVSQPPQTDRLHCLFIDLEEEGLSCSYQWREGFSGSELQPPGEDELISLSKLKGLASALSRVLERLRGQPSNHTPDLTELEDAGVELYEKILPVHVAEELRDEQECAYLEIHIPPELSWIPWELLSDGEHFLCQRFKIARRLQKMGKLFRAASSRRREQRSDRGALILVGDTSGLKAAEKKASNNEQLAVQKCFDLLGLRSWLYADMTSTQVLRLLKKDYDICHFIGHGHYDEGSPAQSGWKLQDGSILTCAEIERQVRSRAVFPFLIFANACDSARSSISESESYISLLYHAFLRQGVPHYIGTLGQILDDPAKEFVRYFYASLASGQSIGEALIATRREFLHRPGVPIWAYYVHYGDPTYRFVEKTATLN